MYVCNLQVLGKLVCALGVLYAGCLKWFLGVRIQNSENAYNVEIIVRAPIGLLIIV